MPITWADANRLANIAAAQAHHALNVETSAPPIDVRGAINAADILLMWRPMPRMFGMYINEPGSSPGILVNSAIPRSARRHTAAHELGHHWLGHRVAVDDGHTVDSELPSGIVSVGGPYGWTDQEKAAEAFAAWFLMPRKAVLTALRMLRIDGVTTAFEVYQLALILGTSFRATARHLPNLRLATRAQAAAWMRSVPGRLKTAADPSGVPRIDASNDVWRLHTGYDGATIRVSAGDRLVVAGLPAGPQHADLVTVPSHGVDTASIYDCAATQEDRETTLAFETEVARSWSVRIRVCARPRGIDAGRASRWSQTATLPTLEDA